MATQAEAEIVADPVGHISISGVHGGAELRERLIRAPDYWEPAGDVRPILLAAAIGAALMYLMRR